jgi:hypothetical protein
MKEYFLIASLLLIPALSYPSSPRDQTYQAGEKLEYLVHYGVINGGIATLELKKDTFAGKEVYHSIFVGQTTGLADALFRVMDIFEAYIDPDSELPVKSIRNVSEGRYKRYNVVLFDRKSRKDSAILTSNLSGQHVTQMDIHDVLSCFYFFRKSIMAKNPVLKRGDMITIMTWFTDELYPIRLRYVGLDEVRTKVGKIKCYKFNPVTESGRLFKDENGATFWFSADKNYLPVKVRFDIFVGSFTVDLSSYEGLVNPLNIRKTERQN